MYTFMSKSYSQFICILLLVILGAHIFYLEDLQYFLIKQKMKGLHHSR